MVSLHWKTDVTNELKCSDSELFSSCLHFSVAQILYRFSTRLVGMTSACNLRTLTNLNVSQERVFHQIHMAKDTIKMALTFSQRNLIY